MRKKQNSKKLLYVLLTLLLLVLTIISGRGFSPAFADTTRYTSALEDLQKDSNFNPSDYPDNATDYSIKVIQIAESVNGELFVYTYQPCQNTTQLFATQVNMSLSETTDETKLYDLILINTKGVFVKYLVWDVKVSDSATRYYNITSIYREWRKGIDEGTGNDNEINEVAFAVGKLFKAETINGEITYSCENLTIIEILNPWAGFIRYNNGFLFYTSACDSHFVAFNTDIKIEELYEADLSYTTCSVIEEHIVFTGTKKTKGKPVARYVYLTDDQRYTEEATGWLWGQDRDYNRIQSVTEFIKNEDLTDEAKNKLNGKQWVLRFAETDYIDGDNNPVGAIANVKQYTEVSEITVLRLKFKSEGVIYNLGSVSDKVMGDYIPDNPQPEKQGFLTNILNGFFKFFSSIALVWKIFVVVAILIIIIIVIVLVVKFIRWIYRGLTGKE